MWTCPLLLAALLLSADRAANGYHNEPCPLYGCPLAPPIHVTFVPAPPGHTPTCAQPGLTFCESLERYPQQLIKFLIDKETVDIEKFLRDESPEDFNAYRKRPDYDYGYDYPKPKVPPELYPQAPSILPQAQSSALHFDVPLNSTNNRYLPAANVNPFLAHSTALSQSFTYQTSAHLRPHYRNDEFFDQNQGPWIHRNSRQVQAGKQEAEESAGHRNPLLDFAKSNGNRAKRQSDSNTVSICPTRTKFIVPRAALNNQGNWMYIVNLEEQTKYSQLVRSEVCMSDTCDGLCSLPLGYSSKCQQQYVQKRLVALEGSGNHLYTDVFWFPHGCMCQVTLDY